MADYLALITIILWPVVPLFWIPVHGLSRIFKRLGLFTYIMPMITWPPLVYLIYLNRVYLLQFKIELSLVLNITGLIFMIFGTLLHIWTGRLIGLWGLMGLPEVSRRVKGKLVEGGPFSVVRHPTYLAHALLFSGVFLITGVMAVSIITILDLLIINLAIIPLEEKELLNRFGERYTEYKNRIRWRFLPGIL